MFFVLSIFFMNGALLSSPQAEANAHEALLKTIKANHQTYLQTLLKGDTQAYVDMFTENGAVLFPGEYVTGKVQLKERQEELLEQVHVLDGDIHTLSVESSGDLAYEIGRFQYTLMSKVAGTKIHVAGRFLVIWRKQADGTWKMEVDSGFPDPSGAL